MSRVSFFIFSLIFFTCSAQQKPDWISKRPTSNDYFIGINYSSKLSDNFIETAKNKALSDLASEISVNLISETEIKTTEIDFELKQSFQEKIKTSINKNIEGYEQVEIWQDNNEYWVYLRLLKTEYYRLQKIKYQNAINEAQELFNTAKKNEEQFDYKLAISNYLLSTKALEPFFLENFDSELKIKSTALFNNARNSTQNILNSIKVKNTENKVTTISANYNKALNSIAFIEVNSKKIPLKNIPLKYLVEKGEIQTAQTNLTTDNLGNAKNFVSSLSFTDNNAILKVVLDIEQLISQNETEIILAKALKKTIPNFDIVQFEKTKPVFFIRSTEKNLNNNLPISIIEPAIKDYLKLNGFVFTSDIKKANYTIEIDSNTRSGGEAYGLFVAFLDANIVLLENLKNEQIYTKQFTSIKGVKQDYVSAGNEAYRKLVAQNLKDVLFPDLGVFFTK
ncbi:MAG: LPP20 family lipoprotein [Bacteroidota bacterium]